MPPEILFAAFGPTVALCLVVLGLAWLSGGR